MLALFQPLAVAVALSILVSVFGFLELAGAAPIRQSIGVNAGGSLPMAPNEFKTLWNPGYGFSGSLRFRLSLRVHGNLEVGYYRHFSDSAAFIALIADQHPNVTVSGYDLWVVPVSLVGEFDLLKRSSTKPYLILGGGYYTFGVTKAAISGLGSEQVQLPDAPESAFGVQAGLGIRTPVSLGITLSVDVNVHVSFTADDFTQFVPVRLGLQF